MKGRQAIASRAALSALLGSVLASAGLALPLTAVAQETGGKTAQQAQKKNPYRTYIRWLQSARVGSETYGIDSASEEVRALVAKALQAFEHSDAVQLHEAESLLRTAKTLEAKYGSVDGPDRKFVDSAVKGLSRLHSDKAVEAAVLSSKMVQKYREKYPLLMDRETAGWPSTDKYQVYVYCFENAVFPNDPGPREVTVQDDGTLRAEFAGEVRTVHFETGKHGIFAPSRVILGNGKESTKMEDALLLLAETCGKVPDPTER